MITTGMLRQQVWMADDEFDYIVKKSQRVLGLSVQYENHPYAEFKKQFNVAFVYGTYVLEGKADSKFSLRHFTKQRQQFLQANDKLYEGVDLSRKKHQIFH